MPAREIYWNISLGFVVYPLMLIMLAALCYGFYRRYQRWQLGRAMPVDRIGERVRALLTYGLGQRRVLREPYAGIMHFLIFWSFFILLIGTLLVAVHEDLRIHILQGKFYLYYSLVLDLFGAAAILGMLMAAYRRYVVKATRLDSDRGFAIAIILSLLVLITGFLVEGARIAATELASHPDWAAWSPVGLLVASLMRGLSPSDLRALHSALWWLHMLGAFGLMASVAYSTLSHILLSPANILLRNLGAKGALRSIDFEQGEPFGAGNIRDFTWKQLLELDACTRCGRCEAGCPSYLSGKTLSPRAVVQGLKNHLVEVAPLLLDRRKQGADALDSLPSLVGSQAPVSEEDLWTCTTCRACLEQCPIFAEPMDKLIEMRRHQVMVVNQLPEAAQLALRNLEIRGHPWAGTQLTRSGWARELGIKEIGDHPETPLLYWVGCTGALVERNGQVTTSLARLLQMADVDFAILGDEEACCGDMARRLGAEFLFQIHAQQNIETLRNYGVRKILTSCPHCYNTLKNEYTRLGADFEVVHHTELLADLLSSGRLRPQSAVPVGAAYHDSCYLGRYNEIFDPPRSALAALGGGPLVEMERRRERSFCCGAGGGHAWMEETGGRRINQMRLEEAREVGANAIVSACPFCLQMFEDGRVAAGFGDEMQTWDIAEIVYQACAGSPRGT